MSQRKALPEKLTVAQVLMQLPVFYGTHTASSTSNFTNHILKYVG
jgi:hypothetical protein